MRIQHGVRAALTVLVLVGAGAAGCTDSTTTKSPVVYAGTPSTSTSPSSTPATESTQPGLMFEGVQTSRGWNDASPPVEVFFLTGYVRNIGDATGTLGVNFIASDNGVALSSESKGELEVPILVPGLASWFTAEIRTGDHKSVLWLYWGTINGAKVETPYTAIYP